MHRPPASNNSNALTRSFHYRQGRVLVPHRQSMERCSCSLRAGGNVTCAALPIQLCSPSSWRGAPRPSRVSRLRHIASAAKQKVSVNEAVAGLRTGAVAAGSVDPAYIAGANYLRTIGFTSAAELARVLDVAMNPNSLFVSYGDRRRTSNPLARSLSVEGDMEPVVEFLRQQGLRAQDVVAVVSAHPPVLCYSVEERLRPLVDYLASVGVPDVGKALVARPSLLGLEADANLSKIVGYLQSVDTPPETIVKYITTSI